MYMSVWQFLTRYCRWVWRRIGVNFILGLMVMALVAVLVWSFDMIESTFHGAVLVTLSGVFPVFSLMGPELTLRKRFRLHWGIFGMVLLLCAALLMTMSERFGWTSLGANVAILTLSFPLLMVIGLLAFRNPLLGVGLVLVMTVAMVALITLVIPREHLPYLLLVPLPAVLLPAFVWALLLYGVQYVARKKRQVRIWGPLWESLLMTLTFVPAIVVAVIFHGELNVDESWSTVFILLTGLLFSSVVSVPLRQFLLDLGNLPPNRRWESTDDTSSCHITTGGKSS